ncbi:aminoglycoside phosphotransferase family protein [Mesorhizobium sp. SB112]|uniref:phosphotransferase family protein n=1 Tax=Mesorhizobium sp. SB112 TaxID=3151853 RepID=UPI003266F7FA
MTDQIPAEFQTAILKDFPELAGGKFSLLTKGWHSIAIDVDDRMMFKFPRHEQAEKALRKEARLLEIVRPAVSLPIPDLALHQGPPLFSSHQKLKGDHLVTAQYETLPEQARQWLAAEMARFYAELHALDKDRMKDAGASSIEAWVPAENILKQIAPVLPRQLTVFAEKTIDAFQRLEPDPYGHTYGFFDGHGWNMAFDHTSQTLNGIYDFADSGFGPLHQEFIYSSLISADLTARIVNEYEQITGCHLDRQRIRILTGVHRLSELAELADDPEHVPMMLKFLEQWAAQ